MRTTSVVECSRCSLIYCHPMPETKSESAGTHSVLTEESFTAGILTISPAQAARYQSLARRRHARYAADLGRSRFSLLEVGCGAAGLAPEMNRLGVAYSGIDIDHRPVQAAQARGVSGLHVGDFLHDPNDQRYDVIFLSQVLEHITRPRLLIEALKRRLTAGGIVHVDVPNHSAMAGLPSRAVGGLGNRLGAVEWPHHSIAYRRQSLHRLFDEDFTVEVFTATPDDDCWGQAVTPRLLQRSYYRASRLVRARSLVVAYGRRVGPG
jgi:SAM-dependent methyltransferase